MGDAGRESKKTAPPSNVLTLTRLRWPPLNSAQWTEFFDGIEAPRWFLVRRCAGRHRLFPQEPEELARSRCFYWLRDRERARRRRSSVRKQRLRLAEWKSAG